MLSDVLHQHPKFWPKQNYFKKVFYILFKKVWTFLYQVRPQKKIRNHLTTRQGALSWGRRTLVTGCLLFGSSSQYAFFWARASFQSQSSEGQDSLHCEKRDRRLVVFWLHFSSLFWNFPVVGKGAWYAGVVVPRADGELQMSRKFHACNGRTFQILQYQFPPWAFFFQRILWVCLVTLHPKLADSLNPLSGPQSHESKGGLCRLKLAFLCAPKYASIMSCLFETFWTLELD